MRVRISVAGKENQVHLFDDLSIVNTEVGDIKIRRSGGLGLYTFYMDHKDHREVEPFGLTMILNVSSGSGEMGVLVSPNIGGVDIFSGGREKKVTIRHNLLDLFL